MGENRLQGYVAKATAWCCSEGKTDLAGVLDAIDALAAHLQLKNLEQKRLVKALEAAVGDAAAAGEGSVANVAKTTSTSANSVALSKTQSGRSDDTDDRQKRLDERKAKKTSSTSQPAEGGKAGASGRQAFAFEPPDSVETEEPRVLRLRVDKTVGAGLGLHATWYGMVVDEIDDVPGQPGLREGDCIVSIGGTPLQEMDDCEPAFVERLADGAEVVVEPHCETIGKAPLSSRIDWAALEVDLEHFAADYQVTIAVAPGRTHVNMSGTQSALAGARPEATKLLAIHFAV